MYVKIQFLLANLIQSNDWELQHFTHRSPIFVAFWHSNISKLMFRFSFWRSTTQNKDGNRTSSSRMHVMRAFFHIRIEHLKVVRKQHLAIVIYKF